MTDKNVATLVDQYVHQVTDALSSLVKTYGQDSVDLILATARIDAASGLVTWITAFVLGLIIFKSFIGKTIEFCKTENLDVAVPMILFIQLPSAVLMGISSFFLSNIWRWVGIFEPKIWVAHRVLEAVTN